MMIWLCILFVNCWIIQIGYWFVSCVLIRKAIEKEPYSFAEDLPGVSLIVCAKNEAINLSKNIILWLEQDYPNFELLIVDDASNDNSLELLSKFASEYQDKLRVLSANNSERSLSGKKHALQLGMKAAKYDVLLLTDADCSPSSNKWIRNSMANMLYNKKEILLGYSPYLEEKTWLNMFIRFEAQLTAHQYFSFALAKLPYMGVGRNLMYYKTLAFKDDTIFSKYGHLASGDDDLMVQQIANSRNTCVSLDASTVCYSKPKKTLREYYNQKTRHYSTGSSYKPLHKFALGILSMSHFLVICLGFLLIFANVATKVVACMWLLRWIIQGFSFYPLLQTSKQTDLLKNLVLFDVLFVLYYVLMAPALLIKKKSIW